MKKNVLIETLTRIITPMLKADSVLIIGIDGVDGAGKTTLGNQWAHYLKQREFNIIRASIDSFHNPKDIRYRKGKNSPDGFYKDSYNYTALKKRLFEPLEQGLPFKIESFDLKTDKESDILLTAYKAGSILIFDGIFLHRPELVNIWDFSIFLDVDFIHSVPRGNARFPNSSDNPEHLSNQRYVEGQKIYLKECSPQNKANLVIDYNDLNKPIITVSKSKSIEQL